jgi:hypothetical protein
MKIRDVGPILLVDEDQELRQSRAALLSIFNIPVQQSTGYTDVCGLSGSFSLVAISLLPSQDEAARIAEYVRRHWPSAKILLLGRLSTDFDDPLYDDIVDARFNPSAFVDVGERLLKALGATLPVRHDH